MIIPRNYASAKWVRRWAGHTAVVWLKTVPKEQRREKVKGLRQHFLDHIVSLRATGTVR